MLSRCQCLNSRLATNRRSNANVGFVIAAASSSARGGSGASSSSSAPSFLLHQHAPLSSSLSYRSIRIGPCWKNVKCASDNEYHRQHRKSNTPFLTLHHPLQSKPSNFPIISISKYRHFGSKATKRLKNKKKAQLAKKELKPIKKCATIKKAIYVFFFAPPQQKQNYGTLRNR